MNGLDDTLWERLAAARHVVVFTGAGMSAESGVPTFRDAQTGLWQRYNPADLATPEAFERDPGLIWRWYAWRRELMAEVQPNAGHEAVARLQDRVARVTVATQNVDGLHQRAGSDNVLELHGSLHRIICSREHLEVRDPVPAESDDEPPRCPQCAAPLRPAVVWFGEALPEGAWHAAMRAAGEADVLLSVGTSGLVQPAASIPMMALEQGAAVVEINPEPTPISEQVTASIRGTAAGVLPGIVDRLSSRSNRS